MSKRRAPRASVSGADPVRSTGQAPQVVAERAPEWLVERRLARRMARENISPAHLLPGRYQVTGYRAAAVASHESRSYSTKSAEVRQQYDREKLIAESRAHAADNAIYRGVIARMVDAVVGTGFTIQITGGPDEKANAAAEAAWREFWADPEVRGLWTGPQLERLALSELVAAGDIGLIKLKSGKLQAIEAERISKGDGGPGIDLTFEGRPKTFYVRDWGRSGYLQAATQRPIAAENMVYVANVDRLSATRGMPALVPSFPMLHRINDVCDSNALAWQILSRLAIKVTRDKAAEGAFGASRPDVSASSDSSRYDLTKRIQDIGFGIVFYGEKGESIEGIERNLPQQNFQESLRAFLRVVGLPVGLPLELILLDASQANLSSMRGILEQCWSTIRGWQALMANGMLSPIWGWRFKDLVAKGFKASWIGPPFPWLEPLKEAQAWASKLDRALVSYPVAVKSLGADPEETLDAVDKAFRNAIARAAAIEKDTGVKVPWEPFAGLAPKGSQAPAGFAGTPVAPDMPAKPAEGDAPPADENQQGAGE